MTEEQGASLIELLEQILSRLGHIQDAIAKKAVD